MKSFPPLAPQHIQNVGIFPLSKQESVPALRHCTKETEAQELGRAEGRSCDSSEATLPSPMSPQSSMGWLSPPQAFQAVHTAMVLSWCEAYNSHTDLPQSLQRRLDHPDPCLPTLRPAVPSTAQRSAQTCARQMVTVTGIKGFNSPRCLFISRAREARDLCIWAAEVGTHFVEPEAEQGSFPNGFTGAVVSRSHPASQPSSLLARLECL